MIKSFRHKGIKLFYEKGDRRKVPAAHADKIARVLARLDEAVDPGNMNLPGYRLHGLKGRRKGLWAVTISGNVRLVFRMEAGSVFDVDLIDYH